MKQILHILAKDARHLWIEILLSIAVVVAFALACPASWRAAVEFRGLSPEGRYSPYEMQLFVRILELLVPTSWWLLISNLIHDDRLVGDRQFWLTRPYEWKKLLAAKLLFLFVFLYLPLFIAQCALLTVAGFSPLSYLPGLLFNLCLISGFLVLPLVAIAAVTSNFARMTLVILGILLSIVAIIALAFRIDLEWMTLPWETGVDLTVLICFCGAAIVSQYSTRKTRASLLLLFAVPVLYFFIGGLIVPSQALVDRSYPLSTSAAAAPAQFIYSPSELSGFNNLLATTARLPRQVSIQIPLEVSGIADRSVVIPDAIKATVETAGGFRWDSAWQLLFGRNISSDEKTAHVSLDMPLAVYDQLQSAPLTVHFTLALTQAQAGRVTSVSLPAGSFSVPDFGNCSPQARFSDPLTDPKEVLGIYCVSALREPHFTQIQLIAHNHNSNCDAGQADAGIPNSTWKGSLSSWPAQFGLSSVQFPYGVWPTPEDYVDRGNSNLHLCPGTPITFTRYDVLRRAQVAVTIEGLQLPTLTPGQRSVITNP
jgi:hypothetical protein